MGLPNHLPRLKKEVHVILLRNIGQAISLCNSTQFIIVELGINIIGSEIVFEMILILCFDICGERPIVFC